MVMWGRDYNTDTPDSDLSRPRWIRSESDRTEMRRLDSPGFIVSRVHREACAGMARTRQGENPVKGAAEAAQAPATTRG